MSKVLTKAGKKGQYTITQGADGIVYCTCRGWKFSSATPKTCTHVKAYFAAHPSNPAVDAFFVQREPRNKSAIAVYRQRSSDTESLVQRFIFGQWLKVMHDPMQNRATLGMLGPKHLSDALSNGRVHEAGSTASSVDSKWAQLAEPALVRMHYAPKPDSFVQHVHVLISQKDAAAVTAGEWGNVEMRAVCTTKHQWATGAQTLLVESGELLHKPFGLYVASPKVQHFNTAGAAKKQMQETFNEMSDQLSAGGPAQHVVFPINGDSITANITGWINDKEAKEREEMRLRADALIARADELRKKSAAVLSDGDFAERMRAKRAAAAKGGA